MPRGHSWSNREPTPLARLARADARRMHVGWVLVWKATPEILHYLAQAGFRFDYRAGGVSVYRPGSLRQGTP